LSWVGHKGIEEFNMHGQFKEYYRPAEEEFSALWNSCVFVFDTNTLLDLYRYTENTRESFLSILEQLKDRIWIPFQVAYEYHENRLTVISTQLEAYDRIEKEIKSSLQKLEGISAEYKRHPLIDADQLTQTIKEAFTNILSFLGDIRAKHPDFLTSDALLERLTLLFEGRVGNSYSKDDLAKKYQEAEKRIQNQIPPGYKDTNKTDSKKYGDFIVWSQMLDLAKSQQKSLIFITNDGKEDWWRIHKNKTIGPRPELIREMLDCSGVAFYMYSTDQFISYAQGFLALQDQQLAIEEIKELKQQDNNEILVNAINRLHSDEIQQYQLNDSEFSKQMGELAARTAAISTPYLEHLRESAVRAIEPQNLYKGINLESVMRMAAAISSPQSEQLREFAARTAVISTPYKGVDLESVMRMAAAISSPQSEQLRESAARIAAISTPYKGVDLEAVMRVAAAISSPQLAQLRESAVRMAEIQNSYRGQAIESIAKASETAYIGTGRQPRESSTSLLGLKITETNDQVAGSDKLSDVRVAKPPQNSVKKKQKN
jgi:hypothetical protein